MLNFCGRSAPGRSLWQPRRITAAACLGRSVQNRPQKFTAFTTGSTWPDSPAAAAGTAHQGRKKNLPRILSVGRLVAFKGFDCLIDACAELARHGLDFTCEIIGDGPLRGQLQSRIEKKNLSGRVQLLGALSQAAVLEMVAAADIFALASVIDAQGASDVFPTVIIEAMAAGRPVVSTRLAGIPEAVVDGETGLLVPPGDPAALATALERLIRDAEL